MKSKKVTLSAVMSAAVAMHFAGCDGQQYANQSCDDPKTPQVEICKDGRTGYYHNGAFIYSNYVPRGYSSSSIVSGGGSHFSSPSTSSGISSSSRGGFGSSFSGGVGG
jgi:hypothetical protein